MQNNNLNAKQQALFKKRAETLFGSQEALARHLGVSLNTVSKFLTGKTMLSGRHLLAMLKALGISSTDL